MKKIIRWFADVSGVTSDIISESNKTAGHQMWENGSWFHGEYTPVANAFYMYASCLKRGNHGPYGHEMGAIRAKVYEAKQKNVYAPEYNKLSEF